MVDVRLDVYYVTITAVDSSRRNRDIATATFKAYARDGSGPRTESLPMFDKGKPVKHAFTVDPNDNSTRVWLVDAQNVAGSPLFSVKHSLDVTADQTLKFVIVPKGNAAEAKIARRRAK